ncbi:MAG: ATP-binding protein [Candidatus Paceibacterota bacterium]
MQTLDLQVEQDHVESLAKVRNPIIAIEELIWNGLDADATRVDVKLELNGLGGLATIKICDNGSGISADESERAFGHLGGSAKNGVQLTPGGRIPHGKSGKGRFRAFGIGKSVVWASRYKVNGDVRQFDIRGHRSSLKRFVVGEEKTSPLSTGVEVTISGIEINFVSLMDSEKATDELSKRLALYLRKYPGICITYDEITVDPAGLEEHSETYELQIRDKDGVETEAELTVIEWKTPTERALYFCDEDGFALEESAPGIQAPGFHFTAYLKSNLIPELVDDGAFAFEDMHPVVTSIVDAAKETLRGHFRARESSRASDLVKKWQEEKVYPYEPGEQGPLKSAEREVFDVCAVKVHEYLPSFERSDTRSKQLTFRLIREALESNPDSLHTILRQVLDLPQDQRDDLAAILDRTHLAAIINAATTVVDRLDFLGSLDELLFGGFKKTLLERKQLHRILAEELWIFGEQYKLGIDDESLANALKKHIQLLGRGDLAPGKAEEVTDLEGKQRILDLMLYRQIPQLQPDSFEHLVIELKRPSCKLGQKELAQIENYAFSVMEDERFDKAQTRWTFILIGNELSSHADLKCRVRGKKYGHIHESDDGSLNIYVKKWSTIIAEAKWRYKFFKEKLELEVGTADGIRYLRNKHAEKVPPAKYDF